MSKKIFVRILMLTVCVFSLSSTIAQEKKITGIVADEKGTTLPGATVSVKGSTNAATTDVNGKFSITAGANAKTLEISFVGMEPKEVAIGKQTDFKISLRSLATAMSEVVVIGYGTAKKANVSSAISSVSAKDLKDLPVAGVDQLLDYVINTPADGFRSAASVETLMRVIDKNKFMAANPATMD